MRLALVSVVLCVLAGARPNVRGGDYDDEGQSPSGRSAVEQKEEGWRDNLAKAKISGAKGLRWYKSQDRLKQAEIAAVAVICMVGLIGAIDLLLRVSWWVVCLPCAWRRYKRKHPR